MTRSDAHGLRAAQQAAWQWALGVLPTVRLAGLAVTLMPQASATLQDLLELDSCVVPRLRDLP
ncbi:hypothetical protein ACFY4C_41495 [Actinomadura viridis]|uniref:hypothetical protein n=1 Tax=Actinomadura viridis TaxID=58110 RepID=UPI00369AC828